MLILNVQQMWVQWPEAGVELLLSPLTVTRRSELIEQCTKVTGEGRKARTRLDIKAFQDAVADECIHGSRPIPDSKKKNPSPTGFVNADGTPVEWSKEAARQLMEIEPANVFVNLHVQGLGIHLTREVEAAGNA